MKVWTGVSKGNGLYRREKIGYRPLVFGGKTASTTGAACYHARDMWCARTSRLANYASVQSGIQLLADGMECGSLVDINEAGVDIYQWALAPSVEDPNTVVLLDFIGSGTNNRQVKLPRTDIAPSLGIIKRDSTAPGVFFEYLDGAGIGTGWSTFMDSTSQSSQTAYVEGVGAGWVQVTNDIRVNELGSGNGEGISLLAFYAGSTNMAMFHISGDAAANRRIIVPGANGRRIKMAWCQVRSGSGGMRIKTADMPGGLCAIPKSDSALPANDIVIDGSDLVLPGTGVNANSQVYTWMVWFEESETPIPERAPAIAIKGKQAVYLPGRSVNSYIDCSTDPSLDAQGSIGIEYFGRLAYGATPDAVLGPEATFYSRTRGPIYEGANTAADPNGLNSVANNTTAAGHPTNFWFGAVRHGNQSAQGNPGPQLFASLARFMDLSVQPSWVQYNMRSGILLPRGEPWFHAFLQIIGTGAGGAIQDVRLWLMGELVKQRYMAIPSAVLGITARTSGPDMRSVIGARWDGASYLRSQRMWVKRVRQYNPGTTGANALTDNDVRALCERALYGSTATPDVTKGLVEEWDASNARNAVLPATINAANNGTIVGGTVITI